MPTATKKKKVSLDVFEEAVLPSLQSKHATPADLQKAIDDGYEIYEETDDGAQTAIKFTVSATGKAAKNEPAAADDDADEKLTKLVAKTMTETLAEFQKQNPPAKAPVIEVKSNAVPDGLRLYKPIASFTGNDQEKKFKAFKFGAFILGGVFGQTKYGDWCKDHGIELRAAPKGDDKPTVVIGKTAQGEGTNTLGGVLVPDELENDLIDLREKYGMFRAFARMRPMNRDTLNVPRRTGGLTAYFTSENSAITESNKTWDSISLTAKKLAALAKYSTEVLEDAIISIADDLAQEIVYAFSYKEDLCGFIGDGTSTYGGIVGVVTALTTMWTSTSTTAAGSVIASGNAMTEVTDLDLMTVLGSLPEFADDGNAAWYGSRVAAYSVFGRLLRAAGGTTVNDVTGLSPKGYGDYLIQKTQVMPRTDTNSQVIAVFGNLRQAADFGDRRQTTISVSDQRYWDADQVGIRGTERFDINVHDVGDGTNAGPVIALRAAAS